MIVQASTSILSQNQNSDFIENTAIIWEEELFCRYLSFGIQPSSVTFVSRNLELNKLAEMHSYGARALKS